MRTDKNSIAYKIGNFLGHVITYGIAAAVAVPIIGFFAVALFEAGRWFGEVLLP